MIMLGANRAAFEAIVEDRVTIGALDIAMATRCTVYDSLYLALAVELGATVVTADDRWLGALKGSPFARFIRPLTRR